MKTVFICQSLNLRVEGLDNRPYAVNERITLKHQGRWLPMIVDEVREEAAVRQVVLRLNQSPDSVFLQKGLPRAGGQGRNRGADGAWIEGLLNAIEGGRGPVVW